jgi:hypothetical protein
VPKQSSRGNKGFLRNMIICVLLFLSDRCTHALPRASADEGIEAHRVEKEPSGDDLGITADSALLKTAARARQ